MVEYATAYAAKGWPVFPVAPSGKVPLTKNGFKDASTDETRIREWWNEWPTANIAVVTGSRSGLLVLDVDDRHGGEESLHELVTPADIPETPTSQTGGGGHHYMFALNGTLYGNRTAILPGLDIRGEGGYVVVPPSAHASGMQYVWELEPGETALAPIPEWLTPLLSEKRHETATVAAGENIPHGSRNATLTSVAGALRRRGSGTQSIMAALREENARCEPPLSEHELANIARSITRYQPVLDQHPLTDTGNAERLASIHGENIRFVYGWRKWVVWDGNRWAADDAGRIVELATNTVRAMYHAAGDIEDKQERERLAAWARSSESLNRLKAMVERTESMLPVSVDELDADTMLLNVANGTVDLRTGAVRPPAQSDLITKSADVAYDVNADAPTFLAFLNEIFDGDEQVVEFLQRAVGYSLTGKTSEHVLFICYGTGSNGKSTLLNTLQAILGDYAMSTPTETIMYKRYQTGIPNDVARLRGARFTTLQEIEEGRRMSEPLVKQLTGGDILSARFLHAEFFEFVPQFKLWLGVNHKPRITGGDHGIWRRIRLIPFTVQVPDERQDKKLPEKLRAESAGILNWAIEGCLKWQSEGLGMPKAVEDATSEYRGEMDVIADFLDAALETDPGWEAPSSDVYNAYRRWAEAAGERVNSQRWLTTKLEERGLERVKRRDGRKWKDVAVKTEYVTHGDA